MATHSHFQRELLPSPNVFWERELGELGRPSRGWATPKAGCPFHSSRRRTSFRVNLETGAWVCFAGCGKGDLVGFIMARDHVDFKTAVQSLGAWKPLTAEERRRIDLQSEQRRKQKKEEARLKRLAHTQLIELRTDLHTSVAIQAEACARLSDLLGGGVPQYPGEAEHCWSILSLVLDDIRDCEARYIAMAGLEEAA